jgi:hypothetical protein
MPTVPEMSRPGRQVVFTPSAHELIRRAHGELEDLAALTGGKSFQLRLTDLPSIWAEIARDLKKQSLVIYRTEPRGAEWRTLNIALTKGGRLRAPSGVYVSGEESP